MSRTSAGRVVVAMAVVLLASGWAAQPAEVAHAASPLALSVSGNRLLDGTGATLQFHGVNRSGTEYACVQGWGIFDGPSDAASVQALTSWNVNAVRIPLNEDCWLGINGVAATYSGATYQQAIVNYVNLLHASGIYAELSLIWGAPGTYKATYQPGAPDADHSPSFWASLAAAFKSDPAVILAPWGETIVDANCFLNGGVCEATYGPSNTPYNTAGMQQAVTAMRGAGYLGPIAIPCITYANDCTQWLTHEPSDAQHQLVAEAHIYGKNVCSTVTCFTSQLLPVAQTVPMIWGETGETYDGSDCGSSIVAVNIPWAIAHTSGIEAWTWDTWGTCGTLISNYNGTPYSGYGQWVQSYYLTLTTTPPPTPTAGNYHPLPPVRILDTRTGNGAPIAPLGSGRAIALQVTGRGGVPATAVSAVVLNVTVTNTSAAGYLIAYPTGSARPLASNLNWTARQTVPNLVEVPVGTGGQVTLYNSNGSTDVVADVAGYVASTATGVDGLYNPVVPARVLDTRFGPYPMGQSTPAPVGAAGTIAVQVAGVGGIPSMTAATPPEAVVLNVTATNPTAASYLTVFPGGNAPLASNLNFTPNQTIPNRVIAPLDASGRVSIFNGAGSVNVVVDVGGWFTGAAGGGGSLYNPANPARILDTRSGTGGFSQPIGPGQTIAVQVAGVGGVPAMSVSPAPKAVVLNVTATGATSASDLVVWPTGVTMPVASDLNFSTGATVPNLVVVKLGPDGKVDLFNVFGSVDVVADVEGWYS